MSSFPAILLQAQYYNLLDHQVRHFTIRAETRDPVARSRALDRYRSAAFEIRDTLLAFYEDRTVDPRAARLQNDALSLTLRIVDTLRADYSQLGLTELTAAISRFILDPHARALAA